MERPAVGLDKTVAPRHPQPIMMVKRNSTAQAAVSRVLSGFSIAVFVLLSTPETGRAVESVDGLRAAGMARVQSVVDGDTVVLGDGRQVRLVGIQAPKLPLGRKGFKTWPLADASKSALAALCLGRQVTLRQGGVPMDHHGRVLAHLVLDDGTWLQGEMLAAGLARVYSFADNRAVVPALLIQEQIARRHKRGIWAHPFYDIRRHFEAGNHIDSFQLVDGRVVDAAAVKGTVYLNYGKNWRTDFTVSIRRRALKLFTKAGIDPTAFTGLRLRVRGWVKWRNGPMIEASHPEQIEILD